MGGDAEQPAWQRWIGLCHTAPTPRLLTAPPLPLTLPPTHPAHPRPPTPQPVWLHGSLGREAATGRGTVFAIRELLKAQNLGEIKNKVCGINKTMSCTSV